MRCCPFLLLAPLGLFAQPAPPSFCFVLAEDRAVVRPLGTEVRVIQHYQERVPYVGVNGTWLKPEEALPLQAGPLFRDSTSHWTVYHPVEGMAGSYVLIIQRKDTMRIDLPEDPKPLNERAWARADRATPEVVRFRKGHFAGEELIADRWAVAAADTLAQQLIAEDEAAYKQELAALEEYYRTLPPPVPPAPPFTPPPPMTEEDWAAYWAQQPPLKQIRLDRVNADTVWVRITGRVMLDGGCASGMPLFGIEMLTDTGWVERIPFDLTQMDCGMPWADWNGQVVMLHPLRWWIAAHQPVGSKAMVPGSYRLFFMGGDLKRQWTEPFAVE
jgi:hypothetical protein